MKKFEIIIEETICQKFEVEAETSKEAMKSAEELYKAGTFVLDNAELCAKQMAVVTPGEEITKWCEF